MDFHDFILLHGRDCLFMDEGFAMWRITHKSLSQQPLRFEHTHSILLVCSGSLCINVDDHPYQLQKNGIADIIDTVRIELTEASHDLEAYQLIFTHAFLTDQIKHRPPFPFSYVLEAKQNPVSIVSNQIMKTYMMRIAAIESVLQNHTHYFRLEILRSTFWMLLLDIANTYLHHAENDRTQKESGRMRDIFEHFISLLPRHIMESHTVGFYASKLCITPQYLSRIVRKISGQSVSEMINRLLIGELIKLLDDTDKSMQEIAEQLHFADQATMTKFFKRHKGISPTEYRKRNK